MRTLTLRQWAFKNWLNNLIDGERNYNVEGALAFEMQDGIEPDLELMEKSVRQADEMFPWKDDIYPESGKFVSIFYLSSKVVRNHSFGTIAWFRIVPMLGNVRRGQVYAYERYLATLARLLANTYSDQVKEVRSLIEVRATTSFKSQEGQQ